MKSGGVNIQGIQLGMGNGVSFAGGRDETWRPSIFAGAALGVAGDPFGKDIGHKLFAIPLNANIERVASGLWSYGGDAAARLDMFIVNVDLGLRLAALSGGSDIGLGVTPFARMGIEGDYIGIEGGALAYSGNRSVDAGRGYAMLYLNPGAIAGLFVRGANFINH